MELYEVQKCPCARLHQTHLAFSCSSASAITSRAPFASLPAAEYRDVLLENQYFDTVQGCCAAAA